MSEFCTELMHWLDGGRSPWHTVAMAEQALTAQGFTPLELGAPFAVKRGGRYFVSSGTFLAAITVGARDVFRIRTGPACASSRSRSSFPAAAAV